MADPVNWLLYNRGEEWLLNTLDEVETRLEEVETEIAITNLERQVVEQLTNEWKVNTLVNCINNETRCDEVPPELLPSMDMLRFYLIINQLQAEKMKFNQKLLLRNLNEFLLRTPQWVLNGLLLSINFGPTAEVDKDLSLFVLPVNLKIEFAQKNMLMSFLDNLENKVSLELPVLYIIQSINYDIVNYSRTQVVNVAVNVYYYEADLEEWSFQNTWGWDAQNEQASDEDLLEDLRSIWKEQESGSWTWEADIEQAWRPSADGQTEWTWESITDEDTVNPWDGAPSEGWNEDEALSWGTV